MPKQLSTQLSTHTIHLDSGNDQFEVTVSNLSDRFATFALDLSASGLDRHAPPSWYRLTPDLSAKIPAGDQVNFTVNILEVPPIPGGFAGGKMNLNVNVTCLELGEEDRQLVNLVVGGSGSLPAIVKLPTENFETLPDDLAEIPLQIHNPNRNSSNLRISLRGLPNGWLNSHERKLQIAPKSTANVLFVCQPPPGSEAGTYPITIEVSQRDAAVARRTGSLKVIATGSVDFSIEMGNIESSHLETSNLKPNNIKPSNLKPNNIKTSENHYTLSLNNNSNVSQRLSLSINRIDIPWHNKLKAKLKKQLPQPAVTTQHVLHLSPAEVALKAGDRTHLTLTTAPKAPWLGWQRKQKFRLRIEERQTAVTPSTQTVELIAHPKLPFWLQCLGVSIFGFILLFSSYWKNDHKGPVNSVQFDGQANTVISAADDHTIRRWQVKRSLISPTLKNLFSFNQSEKAIRVVHYRPKQNNLLAAGLENGEIQIWDVLTHQEPISLVSDRADRVFDLQFTNDSNDLFSIHGSGQILRWKLSDLYENSAPDSATNSENRKKQEKPTENPTEKSLDFAAQAMALVGPQSKLLAIGGRFNQLILWDFEQDRQQQLEYPADPEPEHYLFDIAVAENRPTQFAAADNQGRITLWDLSTCSSDRCRPTDQWTDGHAGAAVNAVAFSNNACYLVSGGDNGQVMLWSLNQAGQVMGGDVLMRSRQPINSVDIIQQNNSLLVVSGGNDHRIRLKRIKLKNNRQKNNRLKSNRNNKTPTNNSSTSEGCR